jgi:hypothetical protein
MHARTLVNHQVCYAGRMRGFSETINRIFLFGILQTHQQSQVMIGHDNLR